MFARAKTVSSERNVYIMKATGIVRRIAERAAPHHEDQRGHAA